MVPTNQCPWCKTVFDNLHTARNHATTQFYLVTAELIKASFLLPCVFLILLSAPSATLHLATSQNTTSICIYMLSHLSNFGTSLKFQLHHFLLQGLEAVAGMQLDPDEGAEAAAQPAKRAAVGKSAGEEEKAMRALLAAVAKLSLSSALQCRVMKAVVIQCYRVPLDNIWTKAHMEATKQFNLKIAKLRESMSNDAAKEKLGLPSTHGFNALVACYLKEKGARSRMTCKQQWRAGSRHRRGRASLLGSFFIGMFLATGSATCSTEDRSVLEVAVPNMQQAIDRMGAAQ